MMGGNVWAQKDYIIKAQGLNMGYKPDS